MKMINEFNLNFYNDKEITAMDILEDYHNKIVSNLEIFDEKYKEITGQVSYHKINISE